MTEFSIRTLQTFKILIVHAACIRASVLPPGTIRRLLSMIVAHPERHYLCVYCVNLLARRISEGHSVYLLCNFR